MIKFLPLPGSELFCTQGRLVHTSLGPAASLIPPPLSPPSGIATALKILFSSADCDGKLSDGTSASQRGGEGLGLELERNEVIALINLLERFSASITYYHSMSRALQSRQPSSKPVFGMSEAVS